MEQNKLPKNIRQIGEKEDWIRVYIEDYVHTYIQRLRGLEEGGISGGVLLGKKQRINGVMHLFIRGAAVADDPFWRAPDQTPGQMRAECSVYFPELEICGFFVSSKQNRNSEVDLVRIFETHFPSEYQILFNVRDQEEEVFSFSGHGLVKLAGYYIYYEKNEEMQSYIIRQESLRAMGKSGAEDIYAESPVRETGNYGKNTEKAARAEKGVKVGKHILGNGQQNSETGRKRNFRMNAGIGTGQNTGQASPPKNKGPEAGRKPSEKKKIRKGDAIVRLVSIAGIFVLAFLLFSDQIKFNKMNDTVESGSGLLSSILKESEAVPAGADSSYISGTVSGESKESSEAGSSADGSSDEKDSQGASESNQASKESSTSSAEEAAGQAAASKAGNESQEGGDEEESKSKDSSWTSSNESGSSQGTQPGKTTATGASGSYVFPLRYLVKKGDSLYAISEKYYGDTEMVDAICLENNITDPSALKYGIVITLPAR